MKLQKQLSTRLKSKKLPVSRLDQTSFLSRTYWTRMAPYDALTAASCAPHWMAWTAIAGFTSRPWTNWSVCFVMYVWKPNPDGKPHDPGSPAEEVFKGLHAQVGFGEGGGGEGGEGGLVCMCVCVCVCVCVFVCVCVCECVCVRKCL